MSHLRHGCLPPTCLLIATMMLIAAPAVGRASLPSSEIHVGTRLLDLSCEVPEAAQPLTRIELWVAVEGGLWTRYGEDEDARSPVRFRARQDGRHDFFFVLENRQGASSGPPRTAEPAHQSVIIDTVPPLVQIKGLELVEGPGSQRWIAVGWTAYDPHLPARPVRLHWQVREMPGWASMDAAAVNSGRYDWAIPEGVGGELQVRIEVSDRAGNVGAAVSNTLRVPAIGQTTPPEAMIAPAGVAPKTAAAAVGDDRAWQLYQLGRHYRARGEHALAAARLVEALNRDPGLTAAARELAGLYHASGQYGGALDIYQDILQRLPDDPQSLHGTALALVGLRRYPDALEHLERLLRIAPEDAEAWLDAGDVFVWMGRTQQAQHHWSKAADLSPHPQIREKARRRMLATQPPVP